MLDTRPFPIQGEGLRRKPYPYRPQRSMIPWWLAEVAYKGYSSAHGTRQSLKRLAERGGFGRAELVFYLGPMDRGVFWIEAAPDDHLPFPIKDGGTIPLWLAEIAWDHFEEKWPGATLEDMAERGGFTRLELVRLLNQPYWGT